MFSFMLKRCATSSRFYEHLFLVVDAQSMPFNANIPIGGQKVMAVTSNALKFMLLK